MSTPITDRISALKAKRDQLATRLTTLEAKARQKGRKRDTQRKIIVGGAILAAIEKDPIFAKKVSELLGSHVGRKNDREVVADLLD